MSGDAEQDSGATLWAMLVHRAVEDPDFRDRLIEDPRSTIEEVSGQSLAEDVEVVVVENGPKTFHIVIPSSEVDLTSLDISGGIPGLFCGPPGLNQQCMMLC